MKLAPVRNQFDTYRDYRLALATVFGLAEAQVVLFDTDLRETELFDRAGVELIGTFLKGSTQRRLRIVLHDPAFFQQRCPRLMALYQRYRHVMTLRATPPHLRHLKECFALADSRHLVVRFHADHARGKLLLNDEGEAGQWARRFENLWQECDEEPAGTPLGL